MLSPRPRIVFMGTPAFAVPSLEACLALGEVVAVVTQPDKPRGRGQEVQSSPVKERALAAGVPVLQPPKVRGTDFDRTLAALSPDVAVVTAYGKILPPAVLAAPRHGCVNVHASLLPRFRGAAPIQWALAAGDAVTGVCLMRMDEGMDTGPVLARAELPIGPRDTAATLFDRLSTLGAGLLREALPAYLEGRLTPVAQSAEGVVMAPMLKKEDGQVDFALPAAVLERRLRAFTPWPGLWLQGAQGLLKLHEVQVVEGAGPPGAILAVGEGVDVACGQGALRLVQVQPEGKRVMPARDWALGRRLQPGGRLEA